MHPHGRNLEFSPEEQRDFGCHPTEPIDLVMIKYAAFHSVVHGKLGARLEQLPDSTNRHSVAKNRAIQHRIGQLQGFLQQVETHFPDDVLAYHADPQNPCYGQPEAN